MQWPEETNAVAGGDTLWTLITRDCGIILNWVHLKKSRIIFFVIVTYWQSMARFRKNDFFKWAQKIKSVFCFIPHTHEGCDFTIRVYHKVLVVSIHTPTKGVTPNGCGVTFAIWVSIHTPTKGVTGVFSFCLIIKVVSIHTPTKGVTMHRHLIVPTIQVSIHTPTKGVTIVSVCSRLSVVFQSTHPRRVWHNFKPFAKLIKCFNPHTHEGCDNNAFNERMWNLQFQSTHPRRVWPSSVFR